MFNKLKLRKVKTLRSYEVSNLFRFYSRIYVGDRKKGNDRSSVR